MGLRHEYDKCLAINQDLRKDVECTPSTAMTRKGESAQEDMIEEDATTSEDWDRDNTDDIEE